MGFRFSRRLSILPGLKLNFSGSGISLSAGVRGAHLNFGSRGTYASLGIPGTGLSYRQRIGAGRSSLSPAPALSADQIRAVGNRENDDVALKVFQEGTQSLSLSPEEARRYLADPRFRMADPETGRRLTPARLEALIKANELKEKREQVQVALQTEAEEYQQLLNFWKPLPAIAAPEDWAAALEKRPFASQIPVPAPPDWPAEQARLLDELTAKEDVGLNKFLPAFVARSDAKSDFAAVWPEREAQVQEQSRARYEQYEQQVAAAAAAWDAAEAQRTDWLQKLLAGDVPEVNHTVAEVLAGLQLPFKTQCDYFLQNELAVYLHVELPAMEEVIPETTKEIRPNGDTCEVRRPAADRQTDYTRLAMGQSLFLAAEVFSYLPLAQTVTVAAYTHRPRIKESDPVDSYVLDVPFGREAVRVFGADDNLTALLVRLGGRFDVDANGGLRRIDPPSWLQHDDYKDLKI